MTTQSTPTIATDKDGKTLQLLHYDLQALLITPGTIVTQTLRFCFGFF